MSTTSPYELEVVVHLDGTVSMVPINVEHRTTAVYDTHGNFTGHDPNEGCEHRTVGDHRAWCLTCTEWCSHAAPCVRCERAINESARRLLPDHAAMDDIAAVLSGREWSADTLDTIADLVRATGRGVDDIDDTWGAS